MDAKQMTAGVNAFGGYDHDLKVKTWIFRAHDGRTSRQSGIRWADARDLAATKLRVSRQDLASTRL